MGDNSSLSISEDGPPYFYVRDKGMAAAHHWDYLRGKADEALCGHGYKDPVTLGEVPRPRQVCRACQDRLSEYHAAWWSKRAEELESHTRTLRARLQTAHSELLALKSKYDELQKHSANQRNTLAVLQKKQSEVNRSRQVVRILGAETIAQKPVPSRLDQPEDVADEPLIQEDSAKPVVAAEIALMKATDAVRQLCQKRSGAISHNDVIESLDKVLKSMDRNQRVMLKAEFRRHGSGLEWARLQLALMGRRMT